MVVSARGGGPQGLPFNEVNPSYTADQDVWGSSLSLSCVLRTCWCMVISKNDPTESWSRKSGRLNGLKPRWLIRSTRYLLKGSKRPFASLGRLAALWHTWPTLQQSVVLSYFSTSYELYLQDLTACKHQKRNGIVPPPKASTSNIYLVGRFIPWLPWAPFRSLGYPEELSAYVPCKKHYMEMSRSPCRDPLLSFGCKNVGFVRFCGWGWQDIHVLHDFGVAKTL